MIIDCHYHLDMEIVPIENLVKSMDAHGVDRVALMARLTPPMDYGVGIEGVLLPFFRWVVHNEKNPLIGLMRKIYASSVRPGEKVSISGKKYKLYPQPDNDATVKACAEYPDRFYGWIVVNPKGGANPVQEIERCISSRGMIGVKAHPFWYDFPVSMLEDTAAWCEEKGKPIIIHLGINDRGDFRLLPHRFPRLKIIYCHAGMPYPNMVCGYARDNENVYVDLASSAYVDSSAAAKAIKLAGPDKCLFGSDGPYHHARGGMFDFGFYKNMMPAASLSDADIEKIFFKNFLRIIES